MLARPVIRLRSTTARVLCLTGAPASTSTVTSTVPGRRVEAARDAVWRAVRAVGGIASPAGSCLWHVVGWGLSLKEWAQQQGWAGRRVSPEAASGILVAALGTLETHFR